MLDTNLDDKVGADLAILENIDVPGNSTSWLRGDR